MSRLRLGVAAAAVLAVTLFSAAPAFAHEHRTVGGYNFVTGWLNEPTFSGVRNGVRCCSSATPTTSRSRTWGTP
jgi:hypothetical protein